MINICELDELVHTRISRCRSASYLDKQTKYSRYKIDISSQSGGSAIYRRYNGAVKDNILGNILDAARRVCKRARDGYTALGTQRAN